MKIAGLIAALLVTGYLVLLLVLAARSRQMPRLEARNGQLKACARSSNCVNTQQPDSTVAPLHFNGPPDAAWGRLRAAVTGLPRTRILAEADGYLRAESTSRWFGFRDDLEALLDREGQLIHLRSASRVGIRDRGVNRQRVEALRSALAATP